MSEEELPLGQIPPGDTNSAEFQQWCADLQSTVVSLQDDQSKAKEVIADLELKLEAEEAVPHEWKKPGLKHLFNIANQCLRALKVASAAIKDNKPSKASGAVEQAMAILTDRIKMLKIADTSIGGYDTVNAYRAVPVVEDSDDDRKLKKAEKAAKEKLGTRSAEKKSKGYRPRSRYPQYQRDQYHGYRSIGSFWNKNPWTQGAVVPDRRTPQARDLCFRCGARGHWSDACPESAGSQVTGYSVSIFIDVSSVKSFNMLIAMFSVISKHFYCMPAFRLAISRPAQSYTNIVTTWQ